VLMSFRAYLLMVCCLDYKVYHKVGEPQFLPFRKSLNKKNATQFLIVPLDCILTNCSALFNLVVNPFEVVLVAVDDGQGDYLGH